jgi:ParB family transcriptional regulator, chromosome partitioning protein
MKGRDRLGKGLGALLGEYLGDQEVDGGAARTLPVAAIAPNPFQPRREFVESELAELAASIKQNGLLQPIVVRPAPEDGPVSWELVAGERRWRAVLRLGWREVPAMVRDVDDRTLLVLALVENLQRAELNALEEAEGYQRLAEEFALTPQQISEVVGRDRSTVANALRLLQLPASVRRMMLAGELSAGHARALLGVAGDRERIELAQKAVAGGWSVREVEAAVQRARPGRRVPRRPARDPVERRLEDELQRALGTAVRIRKRRGLRGTIEIPFSGAEDFERVFERLAGRAAAEVAS